MPAEQEPNIIGSLINLSARSRMNFTDEVITWVFYSAHAETRSIRHLGDTDIPQKWAKEAIQDSHAIGIDPDYNSRSGKSIRVIGYSYTAGALITVILVPEGKDLFAVNAWLSNTKDNQYYQERLRDERRRTRTTHS